jgi:adenylate kinase
MFIIIYGPEGSGKTTQGELLAKKLKLPHLISGDLVRKYSKEDKGIMGRICKETIAKGHYVADSEMYVLWKQRLKEKDVQKGFIIDGFPRNMSQALFLDDKIEKYGKKVSLAIYIRLSEKESIKRLKKRKRRNPDGTLADSHSNIIGRLRRYKAEEKDVIHFYKDKEVLKAVNGEQTIEEIHEDIMERVMAIRDYKREYGNKKPNKKSK